MAGSPAYVHWFVKYSGTAPTATDAAAIANSCKSAWTTNFGPLVSTFNSLTSVVVTDLTSANGAQGVSGAGAAAGTRAGSLPPAVALLVNGHIGRRYRGGKPRQYWPFGVSGDITSTGTWTTTFTTAVQSAYSAMIAAINAITWPGATITGAVSVSYYKGFTVHTDPGTGRATNVPTLRPSPVIDTIASSTVNAKIASQRKRSAYYP